MTSERGKKRALVTTTRHLIWNATPGDTTECYDRTRDPAEDARHLAAGRASDGRAPALARELRRLVAGLALPRGAAAKIAQAVTPPGARGAAARRTRWRAALGDAILVRGYDLSPAQMPPGGDAGRRRTTSRVGKRARRPAGGCSFTWRGRPASATSTTSRSRADAARALAPRTAASATGSASRSRRERLRARYTLYLGAFRGARAPAGDAGGAQRRRQSPAAAPRSPSRSRGLRRQRPRPTR